MAVTWADFRHAEPGLAGSVQERFESHRHAVMATLRSDGAPRLSGMETPIRDGHLWLAMDAISRKTSDLRRDPRFSIHSALDGEELLSGDARVEGQALAASDEDMALFIEGHRFSIDDPSTMALFTADISRVVLARVEDRSLVVSAWTPEDGLTETRLP
ncbi:MAG: pyridoxamine 5'-phosphate oxidase family protein [bacterium]|nr:pyridoxamine 5'-phosphate oxidase family protein [bacterium]MDE0351336.1 pyridoxamine 5'-phosphate oxidase family protein [bacterium]